ncbi:MAG TPA: maleylpyruvate isomerase family mycothiol-dependent enzyme [Jatrophihabitantaceae bacterium]|nr:maleylpyruvate isomerase family mycothiol-dependent enzyme [Jatrophihabitantaceae bacterium]
MAVLDEIAHERLVVAEVLDTLTPEQLATPSYCGDWTVHEVGAHLLMPLRTSTLALLGAVLRTGTPDKANDRITHQFAQRPIGEVTAGLRAEANNRFHPPTLPHEAPLSELVVHGQDIRRPLGLPVSFSAETLRPVLAFLASPKARRGFVPKGRLDGLRLEATDVDWSSGDGALVRGPGAALAYAMCGRTAANGELDGAGVEVLAAR